jgi:hypothetical protein
MTKKQLNDATLTARNETKTALQIVYDALNSGQKKKIIKNEEVKKVYDRYGVNYE